MNSKVKISVNPEAEEELIYRLEYKSNVLKFLKFYEVPTIKKQSQNKEPKIQP